MTKFVTRFADRHNVRRLDTPKQTEELLAGMVVRRLRYYSDLIADNGLSNEARTNPVRSQ